MVKKDKGLEEDTMTLIVLKNLQESMNGFMKQVNDNVMSTRKEVSDTLESVRKEVRESVNDVTKSVKEVNIELYKEQTAIRHEIQSIFQAMLTMNSDIKEFQFKIDSRVEYVENELEGIQAEHCSPAERLAIQALLNGKKNFKDFWKDVLTLNLKKASTWIILIIFLALIITLPGTWDILVKILKVKLSIP